MGDVTDLTRAIAPKSDQLNADDLLGGPRTITIDRVVITSGDQPVSVHYKGDQGKPYKPCKSMVRVMVFAWGADASTYGGRSMTLYRDPAIRWGGMPVGGIRISHLSHITRSLSLPLTETRGKKSLFTVKPLEGGAVDDSNQPDQPDKITDAMRDDILALVSETGTDVAKICQAYNVAAIADLTAAQADKVKSQLIRKKGA